MLLGMFIVDVDEVISDQIKDFDFGLLAVHSILK